jgi:ParB-like chromosome segregation protein Spo0J
MPVVVWQGQIIDGRHRALACKELDIEPPSTEFQGDEAQALALVISLNAARRDLKPTQRAMVAARLANMPQGARTDLAHACAMSQDGAARSLGVSRRLVQAARFVMQNGSPEMVASCERGEQSALDIETLVRRLHSVIVENHQSNLRHEIEAEHAAAQAAEEAERDTPMSGVVGRCRTILKLI